ncbi:MAG: hypothetical protein COB36_10405 [Alphaproteobacteria bacterium]|nr:MAG: hypothetical protein COB36_10405 [Alphaproteobacteria bacterium]
MTRMLYITFEPDNIKGQCYPNDTLLDVARRSGVSIASSCGGRGICKSCIVYFKDGGAPPAIKEDIDFFSQKKITKGWRRACCSRPIKDAVIHIPQRTRVANARISIDGADIWTCPDPVVKTYPILLDGGEINSDSLLAAVKSSYNGDLKHISSEILRALPDLIKDNWYKFLLVSRFGEVISILPSTSKIYGVAIDLGTTNIGVYLVDLRSGATISAEGVENPQIPYGGDLIARITETKRNADALQEMTQLTQRKINDIIIGLCEKHAIDPLSIVDIVVAGNTAMHHIFLGLSVEGLGLSPFEPCMEGPLDIKASNVGLTIAMGAYVHMLPNIAGFVGGDHTAMLLGLRADKEERTVISLDIGTNTEISLIHRGEITSVSCPSGPALEGGNIECGMRAAKGAIEKLEITMGEVIIKTIGEGPPVGICGSGVIDVLAQFYLSGELTQKGQIRSDRNLVIEGGVYFTQHDVRAVQLAKGAIRAGIEVLLMAAGLQADSLDKLIIAGAFGAYINVENAIAIGMLPDIPLHKIEQVGNAAGAGVKLALLSYTLRKQAHNLARDSQYIELAGTKDFMKSFMNNINFPQVNLEEKQL